MTNSNNRGNINSGHYIYTLITPRWRNLVLYEGAKESRKVSPELSFLFWAGGEGQFIARFKVYSTLINILGDEVTLTNRVSIPGVEFINPNHREYLDLASKLNEHPEIPKGRSYKERDPASDSWIARRLAGTV